MLAVIDTNVLVSGLWTPTGNAAKVIACVLNGTITPCYDYRMIEEYRDVLNRPKFNFNSAQVEAIIDVFINDGLSVVPIPLPDAKVRHEDDRAFFEVAKYCQAPLVSGNLKHYPNDSLVVKLADFVHDFL